MTLKWIVITLLIFKGVDFAVGRNSEREYRVVLLPPCPENDKNPIRFIGNVIRGAPNKYYFNGTLFVDRNVSTSLPELDLRTQRCGLDMRNCEETEHLKLPNVCVFFTKTLAAYSTFMMRIQPPLKCPFKEGIYDTSKGYIDTEFMNSFPLMGYNWITSVKLFERIEGKQKMMFCYTMKVNQLSRMKQRTTIAAKPAKETSKK